MTTPRKGALPAITLRSDDFDALDRLVGDLPGSGPAGLLQQELDRAKVCEPKAMPRNVVTLNRWLHYSDDHSPEVRRVQLGLPKEADIDAGRVSVLTPIGVALLGLKAGARFPWETRTGEQRELTVLSVPPPAPVSA